MTDERFEPKHQPVWSRAMQALATEVLGVHPALHAYNLAAKLLPTRTSGALRARLLRLAGFRVGAGTTINGLLKINGQHGLASQLVIGADCTVEPECVLDLSEKLTIGDRVTIEPGVMILTSTHELDFPTHRAGKIIMSPVVIEDGAWLRARCIVLPGVRVGAGAVVDAGAVVNKDVPANTRVGGVPAVVQKSIEAER